MSCRRWPIWTNGGWRHSKRKEWAKKTLIHGAGVLGTRSSSSRSPTYSLGKPGASAETSRQSTEWTRMLFSTLVLFVAHICVCPMHCGAQHLQRSFKLARTGANTSMQFVWSVVSDLSRKFFLSSRLTLYGDTPPLQLFIVARWFAVFAIMAESKQATTLGWTWLVVCIPVSFILPCSHLLGYMVLWRSCSVSDPGS